MMFHDVQHIHLKEFFSLLKRVERWFYYGIPARNAEITICDSEFTRKDISRYYNVPDDKIKIMPLFVPNYISDWKISKDKLIEVKDKYQLPDKFIFYPAQFWGHKNHINLIRAIKRIHEKYDENVNLILSGSQKQNFEKSMDEIKRLKLNEQIRYIGFVDEEDMPYVYKLSTALVYASLFDPNGIPIYEAFFIGSPVVSSNVCALPEQIGDAGLMFDPTNIDDMADKIFAIYTNEKVRDTLIQKGFERLNDLTIEIYAQKWVDIINFAINNNVRMSKI
jgi:glycosyltransferase involved in cell wall biosynthesis